MRVSDLERPGGRTSLRLFSKDGADQEVKPYLDALLIPFRAVMICDCWSPFGSDLLKSL